MPYKTQETRLLFIDDDLRVALAMPRRRRRRKRVNPSTFHDTFSLDESFYQPESRGPSLMRTRRLLMAALKVWELKNGIHSAF